MCENVNQGASGTRTSCASARVGKRCSSAILPSNYLAISSYSPAFKANYENYVSSIFLLLPYLLLRFRRSLFLIFNNTQMVLHSF